MTDPITGCPERRIEPEEYAELETCCMCDEIDDLVEVGGKRYCLQHLTECFASDKMMREFICKNPMLWYEYFSDAIDGKLDPRVTNALLEALDQYDERVKYYDI